MTKSKELSETRLIIREITRLSKIISWKIRKKDYESARYYSILRELSINQLWEVVLGDYHPKK